MAEYIYVIKKKYHVENRIKIGSTKNFVKRMGAYTTRESDFDNTSHQIWRFEIIKSKWNCYKIDKIIQYVSRKYSNPYIKYDGSGGEEHYNFTGIKYLQNFLDKIDVEYEFEEVDIDKLRDEIRKYKPSECCMLSATDTKELEDILFDSDTEKELDNIFNPC